MTKYKSVINIENKNTSLTKIIDQVPKGSQVLDFGCASGYLGAYLIEHKNCKVSGLEFDPEDADRALKKGYEAVINCDLDNDEWWKELENKKYDVAIFADVLEHLKFPEKVLEKTKNLINKDGFILVSIPNIAHISIRLELLKGSFEYEKLGILDNTHLKYWTKESFLKTINKKGLYAEEIDGVIEKIDDQVMQKYLTEFEIKPKIFEQTEELFVYQWIFKLIKKTQKNITKPALKPLQESLNIFKKKDKYIQQLEQGSKDKQNWISKLEEDNHQLITEQEKKNEYIQQLEQNSEAKQNWILKLEKDNQWLQERVKTKKEKLHLALNDLNDRMAPTVDIISINYNSREYIDGYLESLAQLHYPLAKLRIFVVNNGSTDNSFEYLKQKVEEMKLSHIVPIEAGGNFGFTGGNNIAFRLSKADYIMLLNIDTEIHPDCLKYLVEKAENDISIGIAEAKQIPHEHPKYYDDDTGETSWCSGACALIRRRALQETGYFDERFFMYCEDVDLSWRMWNKGWKCIYVPEATCKHYTLDLAKHKKGSDTEFFFGIRNGLMMRFIYGSFSELLRYNSNVLKIIIFSKNHSLQQKRKLIIALGAQVRNFFHLWQRRKIYRSTDQKSPWIKFYDWDYAKLKNDEKN